MKRPAENTGKVLSFPQYTGVRCLMMPYIQGHPESVPEMYHAYQEIIASVALAPGTLGFLTIDESPVQVGTPHRGARARYGRALHTEAGLHPSGRYRWGNGPGWGRSDCVRLDRDVRILLANSVSGSCAVWDAEHEQTSFDGDIGHAAEMYPYAQATLLGAGEVYEIGVLTPHESLPIQEEGTTRQFLRIVSSGVYGREAYFTVNPLVQLV